MKPAFAATLLCFLISTSTLAREWTDASGVFSVEAELVEVKNGAVTLRKTNGKTVTVPIRQLSGADQEYLRTLPGAGPAAARPVKKKAKTVEEALTEKTQFEFIETPLVDAVEFFSDLHGIPILIDRRALDDVGIGSDTPVTGSGDGPFGETLTGLLEKLELAPLVKHQVLLITTPEEIEANMEVRVYRLSRRVDLDKLIADLTRNVEPNSWQDVGGPASVAPFSVSQIVVSQSQSAHARIAKHYNQVMRAVETPGAAIASIPRVDAPLKQLNAETQVEFIETPLADVADFLTELHNARVTIDARSLEDIGLGSDTPVTCNLRGISLASALSLICRELDLTWTAGEGQITITTPETAESKLLLAAYDVRDLTGRDPRGDVLIETVTTTTTPEAWDEVGGPASINMGVNGLTVRHTYHGHQALMRLMSQLRSRK